MQASENLVIRAQGLSKSYRDVNALQPLDLHVARHSIFGFLPPNLIPQAALLATPWTLGQSAVGLALGNVLPPVWPIPVIATALWTVLLVGVALWRFGREEF
jgi:hypothetical protein